MYSATEAREDAADAVSQSLSVLLLGLRLNMGKASSDSTLLKKRNKRRDRGGCRCTSTYHNWLLVAEFHPDGPTRITSARWTMSRGGLPATAGPRISLLPVECTITNSGQNTEIQHFRQALQSDGAD